MTERILDKIRKLHNHAISAEKIGNEHEAQAFAQMVNRLLNEHNLELTDIQFEEQRKTEPVSKSQVDWEANGIKTRQQRIQWIERLAGLVARAHGCRILIVPGTSRIILVGTESNRQIAEYVLVTLVRAAESIANKEYTRYFYECRDKGVTHMARGFRAAFLIGFADRIGSRFEEERARMSQNTTALVRVQKTDKDVMDFMKQFTGKVAALDRPIHNSAGYKAGVNKANSMDIRGNAVTTNNQKKLS